MSQQDFDKTTKQPYARPVLKQIELKADEVLGTACRNSSPASGAFDQATCDVAIAPCVT